MHYCRITCFSPAGVERSGTTVRVEKIVGPLIMLKRNVWQNQFHFYEPEAVA